MYSQIELASVNSYSVEVPLLTPSPATMAVRKASWEGGPEELQMLQAAMSESYLILVCDLPVIHPLRGLVQVAIVSEQSFCS